MSHQLDAVRRLLAAATREAVLSGPILNDMPALRRFLRLRLAHEVDEQFLAMFVDRRGRLISAETLAVGTPSDVEVHPRRVLARALAIGASGIVLAHNHPSGIPRPSRADKIWTEQVVTAAEVLGITVHDHVIISRGGEASFNDLGLLR